MYPLQCSCLENLGDGGACWAAVCGVAQSWTRPSDLAAAAHGPCVCVYVCDPSTHAQLLRHVQPLVTPWIVACLLPLSMGFSRQEYWRELPFPPPGDLPNPGIEPVSPALTGRFFTTEPPGKPVCLW